jgi:hypothetical protein
MVYVVCPKPHPTKLLEHIVLFVGAFCRSQEREAVAPVSFLDFPKSGSGIVKGLVPRNLLQNTIFSQERLCEPFRTVYEFVSIPALDTQLTHIHRIALGRDCLNDLAVQGLKEELTAASTIRAR